MNTSKLYRLSLLIVFSITGLIAVAQYDGIVKTSPDNTYGLIGKRTVVGKLNEREVTMGVTVDSITETKLFDPNGTLRYHKTVIRNSDFPGRDSAVTQVYFDCYGTMLYDVYTEWGHNKSRIPELRKMKEQIYENGEVKTGLERQFPKDMAIPAINVKRYRDGKWDEVYEQVSINFEDNSFPMGNYRPDTSPCPSFSDPNEVFVYVSGIVEDSKPSFLTYGVGVDYTHLFNKSIGLTGEAGINFGSNSGVNYTKITVMAGPDFLPFPAANGDDHLRFSFHVVGGITNLHAKFGSLTNSSTNFSMGIGVGIDYHKWHKAGIGIMADYNPVFDPGKTANNFRVGVGVNFGLKKKTKNKNK